MNFILVRFKQFFINENNKPTKRGVAVILAALFYTAILNSNKEEINPVEGTTNVQEVIKKPEVAKPIAPKAATPVQVVKDITLYKYCSDQEAPCNTIKATLTDNKIINAKYNAKDGTEIVILANLEPNNIVTGQITHKYKVASLGTVTKDICEKESICTWEKVDNEYKLYQKDIEPSSGAAYNFEGVKGFKAYSFSIEASVVPKKEVQPTLPSNAIMGVTIDLKDNSTCLNIRKSPNGEIVDCLEQGTVLKPIIKEQDGWVQLSSGNWAWKESTSLVPHKVEANIAPVNTEVANIPSDPFISGSCKELKERGLGPFYEGDINYTSSRDRDNDGVACE